MLMLDENEQLKITSTGLKLFERQDAKVISLYPSVVHASYIMLACFLARVTVAPGVSTTMVRKCGAGLLLTSLELLFAIGPVKSTEKCIG